MIRWGFQISFGLRTDIFAAVSSSAYKRLLVGELDLFCPEPHQKLKKNSFYAKQPTVARRFTAGKSYARIRIICRLFVVQWNFLGQRAASGCEGFPTFRDLTPSPSSGCACGLAAPLLVTRCPTLPFGHLVFSFGAKKPPADPEDGNGVRSRNVGKPSHPDAAVCLRIFHWILSPRMPQAFLLFFLVVFYVTVWCLSHSDRRIFELWVSELQLLYCVIHVQ